MIFRGYLVRNEHSIIESGFNDFPLMFVGLIEEQSHALAIMNL